MPRYRLRDDLDVSALCGQALKLYEIDRLLVGVVLGSGELIILGQRVRTSRGVLPVEGETNGTVTLVPSDLPLEEEV